MEGQILQPVEEPQSIRHIDGFGDKKGVIITQTIHGSVYENQKKPRYVQYHVSEMRENIPNSPDDIVSLKSSSIINEDEDKHIIERKKIIAWADGYYTGAVKRSGEEDAK